MEITRGEGVLPGGVCFPGCVLFGGVLPGRGSVWFLGGCVLPGGVCFPGGGVCRGGVPPGVVLSQHALRQTPPVNRMTDRCKNITFATSLQMVTRKHSSSPHTNRTCFGHWMSVVVGGGGGSSSKQVWTGIQWRPPEVTSRELGVPCLIPRGWGVPCLMSRGPALTLFQ